jgi:hypothetical protein
MQFMKTAWASPCSLVGLFFGMAILLLGGRVRYSYGVIEFCLRKGMTDCRIVERKLPYRAITFGHIIIAITAEELECIRAHELVHVRQYERWGIFFFPAYLGSSLWQLIRGRRVYWDNYFEVQARQQSGH